MNNYPEHDKLKAISKQSQAVGEFLDWLETDEQIQLAVPHRHSNDCYTWGKSREDFREFYADVARLDELEAGRFATPQCSAIRGQLFPAATRIENLLAEFFEIDLQTIEQEKRAMLAEQRELNAA